MSIVISIGGRQLSGKSTVAAQLGLLIAWLLDIPEETSLTGERREAPKAFTGLKQFPAAPLAVALHRRNLASAMPYRHASRKGAGFLVLRHEALSPISALAASATGGVFVADSVTSWYDEAVRRWVEEANASRERAGKALQAFVGPDGFREINDLYWRALGACQRDPAATILIHQEGSEMVQSDDFGLVNGASTRLRGQAEAGADCHLVLLVRGGLRSRDQPTGERRVFVAADAACMAVGESRPLPPLRRPEDFAVLRRTLWDLLAPSIMWLRGAVREEEEAWASLSEAPDDLPGARRGGERTEAAMLLDQMQTELARHGLTSTAANVQQLVRPMLTECTGWGSLTAAAEHGASASVLRLGLDLLRSKAPGMAELLAHEAETKKLPKKAKAADPAAAPEPFPDVPSELG